MHVFLFDMGLPMIFPVIYFLPVTTFSVTR
jgi:hypothetical protein